MILFFDTETTGFPNDWNAPVSDIENWPRMVQLAYQLYDFDGKLIESKSHIIKPSEYLIPSEASSIHNITTERAISEGIELNIVLEEFKSALSKSIFLVAFNMEFDEKIVGCEFYRILSKDPLAGKNKFCMMKNSEIINYCAIPPFLNGSYKWPKLSELYSKLFNTEFKECHNAFADIQATSKCFWKLITIGTIKLPTSENNEDENPKEKEDEIKNLFKFFEDDFLSITEKQFFINRFETIYPFEGDFARVISHGKKRYITKSGMLILPAKDKNSEFSNGIVGAYITRLDTLFEHPYGYGFIDCEAKELIVIPFIYEKVTEFSDGIAAVKKNGKWGFIDINGKVIAPFVYDWISQRQKSTGLYIAYLDDKVGFLDGISLDVVIPLIYEKVNWFSEGLAAVKKNGKWGFIDINGEETIPICFEDAKSFSESLAAVKKNGKWGFIDNKGNEIIQFNYNIASDFKNGKAKVRRDTKFTERLKNLFKLNFQYLKQIETYIDNAGNESS